MLSLPASILINPAQYLDPGTGSLVLQLLLAAVLAVGVVTRVFWKKIKAFFGKDSSVPADPDDDQDEE